MFLVVKQETLKQHYVTAFKEQKLITLYILYTVGKRRCPRYENDISAKEKKITDNKNKPVKVNQVEDLEF